MAVKRRRSSRRMRRRTRRKTSKRMLRRKRSTPRVTSFKRTCWSTNFTPTAASTSGFWVYFTTTFASISNNAEYVALFDQYKINAVKYTFRPRYDSFAGNDTTDTTLPGVTNQGGTMVHTIADPTSNVVPTGLYGASNLNTFLENGNVRTRTGNKAFSVYFKPMVDDSMATGTERKRASWLPTTNTTIVHNGFHCFFQDVNLTGTFGQSFDIYITYYFQCRGMK